MFAGLATRKSWKIEPVVGFPRWQYPGCRVGSLKSVIWLVCFWLRRLEQVRKWVNHRAHQGWPFELRLGALACLREFVYFRNQPGRIFDWLFYLSLPLIALHVVGAEEVIQLLTVWSYGGRILLTAPSRWWLTGIRDLMTVSSSGTSIVVLRLNVWPVSLPRFSC